MPGRAALMTVSFIDYAVGNAGSSYNRGVDFDYPLFRKFGH